MVTRDVSSRFLPAYLKQSTTSYRIGTTIINHLIFGLIAALVSIILLLAMLPLLQIENRIISITVILCLQLLFWPLLLMFQTQKISLPAVLALITIMFISQVWLLSSANSFYWFLLPSGAILPLCLKPSVPKVLFLKTVAFSYIIALLATLIQGDLLPLFTKTLQIYELPLVLVVLVAPFATLLTTKRHPKTDGDKSKLLIPAWEAIENLAHNYALLNNEGKVVSLNRSAKIYYNSCLDINEKAIAGAGFMQSLATSSKAPFRHAYLQVLQTRKPQNLQVLQQRMVQPYANGMVKLNLNLSLFNCRSLSADTPYILMEIVEDTAGDIPDTKQSKKLEDLARQVSEKNDLLAHASHEFKTPLNAIIGFTELLINANHYKIPQETQKEYLELIRFSGLHLNSLVQNSLDLAKMSAGKRALNLAYHDLRELVKGTIALLGPQYAGPEIETVFTKSMPLKKLLVDELAMRQILLNLLGNAAKFSSPESKIRLVLSQEEDLLMIEVKDQGIGIAQDQLENISMPYYQVETSNHKEQGAGLGLALVKQLLDLHQGHMQIESELGVGTTVRVLIPAPPVEQNENANCNSRHFSYVA
ncbi:sensor histidine kinase [Polycladidibacter stylochi]|uniref:sensor histidine kinase n=1 Tax=Polycladidibacter stylochi TaxID=1807766 RepID=UPI0012E3F252|nr:HAMP domain-containing sensor histidine kinase [Pseudovibrio stylochi]